MRAAGLLLLLACVLAGCSGREAADAPNGDPDNTRLSAHGQVSEAQVNGTSCFGQAIGFHLPVEVVRAQLPPGYEPWSIAGEPLAQVSLVLLECPTLRIGNVTEEKVRAAWSETYLAGGETYRWEIVLDEPEPAALLSLLRGAGWSVLEGDISFDLDVRTTIVTAPALRYETVVPRATNTTSLYVTAETILQVGQDGRQCTMVETIDLSASVTAFATGTTVANGGVLGALQDAVSMPALAGLGQGVSTYEWSLALLP